MRSRNFALWLMAVCLAPTGATATDAGALASPFRWGSTINEMLRDQPGLVEDKNFLPVDPPEPPIPKTDDPELLAIARKVRAAYEGTKETNRKLRETMKGTRRFKASRPMELFGDLVEASFMFKDGRLMMVAYRTEHTSAAACQERFRDIQAHVAERYGPATTSRGGDEASLRDMVWELPTHTIILRAVAATETTRCVCIIGYRDPNLAASQKPKPAPF